jgi:hypothetical protein
MKRKLPPKGKKGGKRPGAGRKRGSTRPEKRVQRAKDYVIAVELALDKVEREGRMWAYNEAVARAYKQAYVLDYPNRPDLYRVGDGKIDLDEMPIIDIMDILNEKPIDILDDNHFGSYRKRQKQTRKRGKSDSGESQHPTDFAVAEHEVHFREVIEFLQAKRLLKSTPSEALERVWRGWPTLERRRRKR